MSGVYAISAEVRRDVRAASVPTFYLDCNTFGLTTPEEARKVARAVLDPFDEDLEVLMTISHLEY